jgi:hypothetical protein
MTAIMPTDEPRPRGTVMGNRAPGRDRGRTLQNAIRFEGATSTRLPGLGSRIISSHCRTRMRSGALAHAGSYVLVTVSKITDAEAFKVTMRNLLAADRPFASRLAVDMDKPVLGKGRSRAHRDNSVRQS